jgi:hypothetical protein
MPYADRERQLAYQRDYMKQLRAQQPKQPRRKHPLTRELPEITPLDLAWLAGLLEGEAWFGRTKRSNGRSGDNYNYRIPIVQVVMTDEDVIRRVGNLTNCGVYGPHNQPGGRHMTFMVSVHGHKALKLMGMLRPLMGERRAAKIGELLTVGVERVPRIAAVKPGS